MIIVEIGIFLANGLSSVFEQARIDADDDLNVQIDIFSENQKEDEEQFLGDFDSNDNQAVCQAIQLQVRCSISLLKKMNIDFLVSSHLIQLNQQFS